MKKYPKGNHPRIYRPDWGLLLTARCADSAMWLVNNKKVDQALLMELAVCTERYNPKIFAFAIEGNHYHIDAQFVDGGLSDFLRDYNSWIANHLPLLVPEFKGGRLWGRRASSEQLPGPEDIEDRFFYTVLQPVNDGLVERISEFPGYNCFSDAVNGVTRKFKVLDTARYNSDARWKKNIRREDYIREITFTFERLPGYENLSQKEYSILMHKKLEERRLKIVAERKAAGKGFLGPEALKKVRPGTRPRNTKKSTLESKRPRILCVCPIRREKSKDWYFTTLFTYQEASRRYRAGELNMEFPPNMYRPPFFSRSGKLRPEEGEFFALL